MSTHGKSGHPGKLKAWAAELSGVVPQLQQVNNDLKAGSPYALGDNTYGTKQVQTGTSSPDVPCDAYYGSCSYDAPQPVYSSESTLVSSGATTVKDPATGWGGSKVAIGKTSGVWYGDASENYAYLLQQLVDAVDSIIEALQTLSKDLKSIAKSIIASRKFWNTPFGKFLSVFIGIIAAVVIAVISVFVPPLFATIPVIDAAVDTAATAGEVAGEVAGDIGGLSADVADPLVESGLGDIGDVFDAFPTAADPWAESGLGDIGDVFDAFPATTNPLVESGLGDIGDVFDAFPATTDPLAGSGAGGWSEIGTQFLNWAKVLGIQSVTDGTTQTVFQGIENWIHYGSPFKGWSKAEAGYIVGSLLGIPAAQVAVLGVRAGALGLSALVGDLGDIGAGLSKIGSGLVTGLNTYKFGNGLLIYTGAFGFGSLIAGGVGGEGISWQQVLTAMGIGLVLGSGDQAFAKYFKNLFGTLGGKTKGVLAGVPLKDLPPLPSYKFPPLTVTPKGGPTVIPLVKPGDYTPLIPFKIGTRGLAYPGEIVGIGSMPGHHVPWWPAIPKAIVVPIGALGAVPSLATAVQVKSRAAPSAVVPGVRAVLASSIVKTRVTEVPAGVSDPFPPLPVLA